MYNSFCRMNVCILCYFILIRDISQWRSSSALCVSNKISDQLASVGSVAHKLHVSTCIFVGSNSKP